MNIYLHVEISARELESKLLIGAIAASRGHSVLISDRNTIMRGVNSGRLKPGIYHTKALTPSQENLEIHGTLSGKGFLVTSIDEEAGLFDHGYENVARARYSPESLSQAAAVFAWGSEDAETLRRVYPDHAKKIFMTGSSRVDLWGRKFSNYAGKPKAMPSKPFLLISSNLSSNETLALHERVRFDQSAGYFRRDPKLFAKHFIDVSEAARMTLSFIEVIRDLANGQNDFDIVLRPHPKENIEAWRVYLSGLPNVHVLREGSITPWLQNAFAVMHNGCTTAVEATVYGSPLVTWLPFERQTGGDLANELGYRVSSIGELTRTLHALFEAFQNPKLPQSRSLPEVVSKKVHIDPEQLAAEKIISVWEAFPISRFEDAPDWGAFRVSLAFKQMLTRARHLPRRVLAGKKTSPTENQKFPPINVESARNTLQRFQEILELEQDLKLRVLDDHTILLHA